MKLLNGWAVALLTKLGLKEDGEFSFSQSGKRNEAKKYFLKPAAFKKLLLAARTKAAQKAAEYFIKIEESPPD